MGFGKIGSLISEKPGVLQNWPSNQRGPGVVVGRAQQCDRRSLRDESETKKREKAVYHPGKGVLSGMV
jgi:hypothetical protein